jgi:high-affinity Fe2+/Pb2+ permease
MSRIIAYSSATAAAAGAVASFATGMLASEPSSNSADILLIGGGLLSFIAGALVVAGWREAEQRVPVRSHTPQR